MLSSTVLSHSLFAAEREGFGNGGGLPPPNLRIVPRQKPEDADALDRLALSQLWINPYGLAVGLISAEKYPGTHAYKSFCKHAYNSGFLSPSGRENFNAELQPEQILKLSDKLRNAIDSAEGKGLPDYLQAHCRLLLAYFYSAFPSSSRNPFPDKARDLITEASGYADYEVPSSIKQTLTSRGFDLANFQEKKTGFWHLRDDSMQQNPEIVIFGGTGDLALRTIVPQLLVLTQVTNKYGQALLGERTRIIIVGREKESELKVKGDSSYQQGDWEMNYREYFLRSCKKLEIKLPNNIDSIFRHIRYVQHNPGSPQSELTPVLEERPGNGEARLFFFSLPPKAYESTWKSIEGVVGRNDIIIIEKPFGESAGDSKHLSQVFQDGISSGQVHVMDHYLGKPAVALLLDARRQFLDDYLDSNQVKSVEIVISEDLTVNGRGAYYDGVGAVRDMVQNHMLALAAMLTTEMPHPADCSADAFAANKLDLLKRVTEFSPSRITLGQSTSYVEHVSNPDSKCPTFFAGSVEIDNERWAGVPFIMKHGKYLDGKYAFITINFQEDNQNVKCPERAILIVQPDPRLVVWYKGLDKPEIIKLDEMRKFRSTVCVPNNTKNGSSSESEEVGAYGRQLWQALNGNPFFNLPLEILEQWRIVEPALSEELPVVKYADKSKGPGLDRVYGDLKETNYYNDILPFV